MFVFENRRSSLLDNHSVYLISAITVTLLVTM